METDGEVTLFWAQKPKWMPGRAEMCESGAWEDKSGCVALNHGLVAPQHPGLYKDDCCITLARVHADLGGKISSSK